MPLERDIENEIRSGHDTRDLEATLVTYNWTVWGDGREPILEDCSYNEMKAEVDSLHEQGKLDVYGMDSESNTYPHST